MADIANLVPKVNTASLLNGVLTTLAIIITIAIIGILVVWWFKKRKYGQYKIIIWEKDSTGNTHEYYDRGGVFLDKKTGFKLLFLEKQKKGLNPNNIPYVISKDRKGRLVKTVYLKKIGVSNLVYCEMKLDNEDVNLKVGEEDVNWASQEIETIKRQYNKENWLTKLAPYILFIITIMIVMIVLISLFNKFGVIEQASANLQKVAESNERATGLLVNLTQSGVLTANQPIIVPGVIPQ